MPCLGTVPGTVRALRLLNGSAGHRLEQPYTSEFHEYLADDVHHRQPEIAESQHGLAQAEIPSTRASLV